MGVEGSTVGFGGSHGIVLHHTAFRLCILGIPDTVRILGTGDAGRIKVHHRTVGTSPVVNVLTPAPLLLEALLTLAHSLRVIEIPQSGLSAARNGGSGDLSVRGPVAIPGFFLLHSLLSLQLFLLAFLLLFLLDEVFYHLINNLVTLFLRHLGQSLQRVLQGNGIGIGHQFVEHFRTLVQLFVVLAVFVQQTDGLAIAALGVAIFLLIPIHITQRQQQHTFLDAATCRLLHTFLIGLNGMQRVALGHIDIADGIVHLVEILLVVIRTGHAFQLADFSLCVAGGHHLCLGNAGIKLQLVGWIQADAVLIGFIGILLVAQQCLYLSHQEPLPGTLLPALLVLDGQSQIGHGLLILFTADVIVGKGVVPVFLGTIVNAVTTLLHYHVLSIIQPAQFHIAFGLPGTGQILDGRLRVIQSGDVREGGCGLLKLSLLELRLTQQHPGMPQEGVVLPAVQPFNVLGSLPAALVPLRTGLDAIELDDFLRLLDGSVVVSLAQFPAALVGNSIQGNQLRTVVLVAVLLLQATLNKGLRTIIIGIIASSKRLPETTRRRILLG